MNFFTLTLIFVTYVTDSTRAARPFDRLGLYQNTLRSSSTRIIGGSLAEKDQFPYQVSIRYSTRSYFTHICGGTLIHPQYVLTAGHCHVGNGSYEVAVGLLYRLDNGADVQVKKITEFIVHPQYPGGVAKYDIAVIQLQEPVKFSKSVNIARLPPTEEECDIIEPRTLSGWGLTQNIIPIAPIALRFAVLPRISTEQCKKNLIEIHNSSEPLDESMLCTVANEGKKQSACSGDSGGPLVDSSTNTIVGVVSWGLMPCGEIEKAPSVYTNVCKYTEWIQGIINKVIT